VCASKTKHIEIRYHAIRELIQKGYLVIKQIPTKEQIADGLTKALKGPAHTSFALAVLGINGASWPADGAPPNPSEPEQLQPSSLVSSRGRGPGYGGRRGHAQSHYHHGQTCPSSSWAPAQANDDDPSKPAKGSKIKAD
jgi:hypothetical protein